MRRSGQVVLGTAALPLALNLAAIGRAAAFNASGGDYKALVCVFMYGGNDYANTVVPYDNASYDQYSTIRGGRRAGRTAGGIALAQAALAPTLLSPTVVPVDSLGVPGQFALHPSMTGLAALFNAGHAAVQLNVGPSGKTVEPCRLQQHQSHPVPTPAAAVFAQRPGIHLAVVVARGLQIGWGGNMGDLVLPGAGGLNTHSVFTGISVAGNTVFLSGDAAMQYQVSTSWCHQNQTGHDMVYGSTALPAALKTLVQQTSSHKLESDYNAVTRRAIDAETAITAALRPPSRAPCLAPIACRNNSKWWHA